MSLLDGLEIKLPEQARFAQEKAAQDNVAATQQGALRLDNIRDLLKGKDQFVREPIPKADAESMDRSNRPEPGPDVDIDAGLANDPDRSLQPDQQDPGALGPYQDPSLSNLSTISVGGTPALREAWEVARDLLRDRKEGVPPYEDVRREFWTLLHPDNLDFDDPGSRFNGLRDIAEKARDALGAYSFDGVKQGNAPRLDLRFKLDTAIKELGTPDMIGVMRQAEELAALKLGQEGATNAAALAAAKMQEFWTMIHPDNPASDQDPAIVATRNFASQWYDLKDVAVGDPGRLLVPDPEQTKYNSVAAFQHVFPQALTKNVENLRPLLIDPDNLWIETQANNNTVDADRLYPGRGMERAQNYLQNKIKELATGELEQFGLWTNQDVAKAQQLAKELRDLQTDSSFRVALREGDKIIEQDKSDRADILRDLSQSCNDDFENLDGVTGSYRTSEAVLNQIQKDLRRYNEQSPKVPDLSDKVVFHEGIADTLRDGIERILDDMARAQAQAVGTVNRAIARAAEAGTVSPVLADSIQKYLTDLAQGLTEQQKQAYELMLKIEEERNRITRKNRRT